MAKNYQFRGEPIARKDRARGAAVNLGHSSSAQASLVSGQEELCRLRDDATALAKIGEKGISLHKASVDKADEIIEKLDEIKDLGQENTDRIIESNDRNTAAMEALVQELRRERN